MVYIPGITKTETLYRRKGGGKGVKGSGGSGTIRKSFQGLPLGKSSATVYGSGGGPVSTIPSGAFAGRTAGGGLRTDVYGNRFVACFLSPDELPLSAMEFFFFLFLLLNVGNMGAGIRGIPSA